MISRILCALMLTTVVSFGAQSSGIFFEAHVSQGKMKGDKLLHFEGTKIGSIDGDSIRFIANGKEETEKKHYSEFASYPVEFQYAVRYSFLAGYEKSFNKVLSVRGAVGYQKALMDAHASTIPGFAEGNMTEVAFVSAEIDRHWISIPIDFKVTLPIRRGGLFLAAGPKSSILLFSKYTDSLTNVSEDLGDLTPRFNLGLGFHLGVEFPIARAGFLFIESGYSIGLLNTSPISSANTKENEFAPLGIGFRINLPTKKG